MVAQPAVQPFAQAAEAKLERLQSELSQIQGDLEARRGEEQQSARALHELRSELEDRIYGCGEEVESNAIEFLIHSLRKKLGADTIKNVRGMGWMVPKTS